MGKTAKMGLLCCLSGILFLLAGVTIYVFADKNSKNPKEFLESVPLYSVTSQNSNAEFGEFENAPEVSGIKVELFAGDKFVYNKPLDLRGMTLYDTLIELCIVPKELGMEDFCSIQIVLTDVYDSTNKVTVDVHRSNDYPTMSWGLAGATDQILSGREAGGGIHKADGYGQWCFMNFRGDITAHVTSIKENVISLAYDYEQKSVNFCKNADTSIFADFDSPDYFRNPWKGFTTGEVFLSITCDMYTKSHARFVITDLFDNDLTQTQYIDNVKPEIQIDFDGYEDSLPVAVVNKPYRIFDAIAADNFDGFLKTQTKVFRNYYMSNRASVSVVNGKFIPEHAENYFIEYSCVDSFNNKAKKVVEINVQSEIDEIIVDFNKGESVGFIGQEFILPDFVVSGGSGRLSIHKNIVFNNDIIEINDGSFTPFKQGQYLFNVKATDYIGNEKENSFTINIVAGDKPVFVEKEGLPKYFIRGKSYSLPIINAYDYSGDSEKLLNTKIFEVTDTNKTQITSEYIPDMPGDVKIIYEADNGKATSELIYNAKIIDVLKGEDGIDNGTYFDKKNFDISSSEEGVTLKANSENAEATYILPISNYNLNVEFKVLTENNNFKKLNFYLTNYEDCSKFIKLTYENLGAGRVVFYLNDDLSTSAFIKFSFNGNRNILSINTKKEIILPDSILDTVVNLTKYYDGTILNNSLMNSKCYFKVEILGAKDNSAVTISNIAGSVMSDYEYDLYEPLIYIEKQQIGYLKINSEFVLNPALVVDVFDSEYSSYLSVYNPDNSFVKDINGKELKKVNVEQTYRFMLDKFGIYKVVYYAVDSSGNENNTVGIVLTVNDDEAPVINLKGNIIEEVALGNDIYIPGMSVSDNLDSEINSFIYVVSPNGEFYKLNNHDGFKPDIKGTYTIRYVAIDKSGNMNLLQFYVNVV